MMSCHVRDMDQNSKWHGSHLNTLEYPGSPLLVLTLKIRRRRAVSINKLSLLSWVAPLTPTLFFTVFFACGSKKRCFRLHFDSFLEVERFQNRVLGKSIKIIELHGHEAFSGDIGKGKKMVKMCTKSTKNRRSGKAQNVGGFGTVFECFCCVRQGPKGCKLQCFCKL